MSDVEPLFTVGTIPIHGDLILSPMDGYSNSPFRSLCRQFGSAMSYTEFVRDKDILDRPEHVEKKLIYTEEERPVVYQIYGHDPDRLLRAALKLQGRQPDVIDINMGCPNSAIVRRGAGAGMMRHPLSVARTIEKLTAHLEIPITAKIRLGWDDCRNYLLIARIIEECGGALIAVHGRTKEDRHSGLAELDAIAEIKERLSIPVIGNGGVKTVADIERMKEYTGCDGVMIGRGARGNPWIFSRTDRDEVPPREVQGTMFSHLDDHLSFFGVQRGMILFRKFAAEYLAPYDPTPEEREEILTLEDPQLFKRKASLLIQRKTGAG